LRFDHDVCSSKFVTPLGVDYRDKLVKIDGASVRLQLWDTAGQERFRSLTNNFFGRADGCECAPSPPPAAELTLPSAPVVLSYDVSNRTSFEHVQSWMQDINTRAPPDVDIVLCGNKCDLGEDERKVSIQEGAGDASVRAKRARE
jgi:GTPase SAR1 family protein